MGIQPDGGVSTYYDLSKKLQDINQLRDILSSQLDNLVSVVIRNFTDFTEKYFVQANNDFQCEINEHFNDEGKNYEDLIEESIIRQARAENRYAALPPRGVG